MELDSIVVGDCLDVMGDMPDNEIDTIITDPPYGIKFMGKDWDHGIPGPRYWREALRVAKPGAFLLAFGGTRTWHRLACAIEDAGWELRDTMMWVYAQGFPKSYDISKGIDKAAGAERVWFEAPRNGGGDSSQHINQLKGRKPGVTMKSNPATDAARAWDGWGTALKPAWEPIIVAMKPVDSTFASNALRWGVAGLWIDGARVTTDWNTDPTRRGWQGKENKSRSMVPDTNHQQADEPKSKPTNGRFPANLLFSHAPGCCRRGTRRVRGSRIPTPYPEGDTTPNACYGDYPQRSQTQHADPDGYERVDDWECQPDCPVAILAAQSGARPTGGLVRRSKGNESDGNSHVAYGRLGAITAVGYDDSGTAARFFYQAKASRNERNLGCQDVYWRKDKSAPVGFVRIDRDEWEALPEKQRARGNIHPTVKPLGVVEYLCRLTRTPTGGVVFDPFAGTGTTALGAFRTGRRWLCCDNQEDYVYLANLRIEALKAETPQLELSL